MSEHPDLFAVVLHLHQERLNPVMVLLLGDRGRHRGPFSQPEPLPEGRDQSF